MERITFDQALRDRIVGDYERALSSFGSCRETIVSAVDALEGYERLFAQYLYAHMPVSDACAYEPMIIVSYAEHAAFLLENSEFLEGVSASYFLQYVVAHRINSEDITDCRRFFYDLVHERVKGMTRSEAVLEANNWCYEQATYRSTSIRTESPITMYKSGFGRCGEESTFLTTVLRSLGIPARQVYVPRWSHSDSNHAWVEVWCEDGWHYTGACEPKPILDNGWFPYAASRAMVVHSRLFDSEASTDEEVTEHDGLAVLLNESARYSYQTALAVTVRDEFDNPVEGARVDFEIVNSAEFFPIASLETDADGVCRIHLGKGDVHIAVTYGGHYAEAFADLRETSEVMIMLDDADAHKDTWLAYHINAPESAHVSAVDMTDEQEAAQNAKNAVGDRIRNDRIDSYYDESYAAQWSSFEHIRHALDSSKGNFAELRSFLDTEYEGITAADKDALMSGISDKDCRDITRDVLEDALSAFTYRGGYSDEIFNRYILSPRLYFEMATPFRAYIREHYGFLREMAAEPVRIWNWVCDNVKVDEEREYLTIFSVPEGTLKAGSCSETSRMILFVAICRTFGIPARMDMLYGRAQYYDGYDFRYVEGEYEPVGTLILHTSDEKLPEYEQSFTVGRKSASGRYETIGAWDRRFENGTMELRLAAGDYRLLTCERTASGSIVGRMLYLTVGRATVAEYEITCRELKREDFISRHEIPVIRGTAIDQGTAAAAGDVPVCGNADSLGILMFAEPGKEPTEHVFNELLEINSMGGLPMCDINILLRDETGVKDPTLQKVLRTYPHIRLWKTDFDRELTALSPATGVAARNLPYICVTEGTAASLYCCSGYNVGCVDVFARLVRKDG